jgi:hypothetical protein
MSGQFKQAFGTLWEEITTHRFAFGYRLIVWRNKHYADTQIMVTFEGGKNSDNGWVRIDWYTVGKQSDEDVNRIAESMINRARQVIFFSLSEEVSSE